MNILRLAIALIALAYLLAAYMQHRRGKVWPVHRIVLFTLGVALTEIGLSTWIMHRTHADLRAHMLQHLLTGMYAPIALIFARPMTLLLKTLPTKRRKLLISLLGHWILRFWSHPITTTLLNIGGMAVLYLTQLYALQRHSPSLSILIHFHFIAAGCLFTWSVTGPDPAPNRPTLEFRLVVLIVAMACHAILGKWMYFVHAPAVPGATVLEIEQAAQWMFYGGELGEAILVFILVKQWLDGNAVKWPLSPPLSVKKRRKGGV